MPIGEIIGEVFLRPVLEFVFYFVGYYTGAATLWVLTLGRWRIAPLSTIESTNRGKNHWNDRSIWLHRPKQGRVLKAEWVCVVGLLLWMAIGAAIYFTWESNGSEPSPAPTAEQP